MMLVLLAATSTPNVSAEAPSVTAVGRPVPPRAEIGSSLDYRTRERPDPRRSDEAALGGRTVRFRPTPEYDRVEVSGIGRDGTALLHRSYYGLYATDLWTIVHGSAEVPVRAYGRPVYVAEYRDARDYAGAYYEPGEEPGPTPARTEPKAFVRENGRTRLVGRGTVVAWNAGGAVATKVQVDADGRPAGYETAAEERLRVLDGGRTYDLGPMRYVGRATKGGFVLTDDASGAGVYVWRGGRLYPWIRLPRGWSAQATDGLDGLLACGEDRERMAILRGGRIHPLRLSPPTRWRDLDWNEARLLPGGKVVIEAYAGLKAEPRTVVLTPR